MGKVIKLAFEAPPKFGLEKVQRVRKRKKKDPEDHGQLNIFFSVKQARVVQMSSQMDPFEHALKTDDSDHKKASDLYWKAIEAGDCVADAYCNLGIIAFQQGGTAKAIDCFTNSLKHDPRHFESHYNLANLYSDVGNLALAQVHYEISAEIQPEFPNIYFNLGLVYAMNKDYKKAVKTLSHYLELVPDHTENPAVELLASLKKSVGS